MAGTRIHNMKLGSCNDGVIPSAAVKRRVQLTLPVKFSWTVCGMTRFQSRAVWFAQWLFDQLGCHWALVQQFAPFVPFAAFSTEVSGRVSFSDICTRGISRFHDGERDGTAQRVNNASINTRDRSVAIPYNKSHSSSLHH